MINISGRAEEILGILSSSIRAGSAMAVFLMLLCVLAPAAAAQTFSLLHQFKSGPGGINPAAGVVLDAKGNLYGTTFYDGAFASGTVFKMSAGGKEKVLYSFTGIGGDGAFPEYGTLVRDSSGNLYGTTFGGGINNQFCFFACGTVFKVDASGNETVLYSFTGSGGDGYEPWAGLVRDPAGNLYGTTFYGGAYGVGTVFTIDPTGKETVLHSFDGSDGGYPWAGLIRDVKGNLYGTTIFNTVFKVDKTGQLTVLYTFTGQSDGRSPRSPLVRDSAGNLYGTTYSGGTAGYGTVFKVNAQGQETVLYNFTGGGDGRKPRNSALVRDSAGNLYGTTGEGGSSDFGVVFKLDTAGTETVLHSFSGSDGKIPYGTLVRDKAGNLYGTTYQGGIYGGGVVFKIAP
jgi:uncharacterized repeat protein (TIGR03803 family)